MKYILLIDDVCRGFAQNGIPQDSGGQYIANWVLFDEDNQAHKDALEAFLNQGE